jgi:hypothetical protein
MIKGTGNAFGICNTSVPTKDFFTSGWLVGAGWLFG